MSKNKGEPSLEKIDDYNGNESKQKKYSKVCNRILFNSWWNFYVYEK